MSDLSLQSILLIIFVLVLIIYALTSFFLWYHWKRYEVNSVRAKLFTLGYFIVSFLLVAIAGGSLLLYFASP